MIGVRGTHPVLVRCSPGQAMSLTTEIPGVVYSDDGQGVCTTWEALPIVAGKVGIEPVAPPAAALEELPGYPEFQALTESTPEAPRPYQVEDSTFLANRAYAFLCNPMRSGKSATALWGSILAKHNRVLILCPSIAKWVWGDEVHKWLGAEALILAGLSMSRVLQYCGTCKMRGRLPDGSRCPACRQRNGSTYGYKIIDIQETAEPRVRDVKREGALLWRCRKHPDVWSKPEEPRRCPECAREMVHALSTAKVVVANYDILAGKAYTDLRSRVEVRGDLRGWEQVLTQLQFDLAIVDESHTLRAFDTSEARRGKMVSDRVRNIVKGTPAVWMLTGTPIFGMVRDLYGQLDCASDGLWGNAPDFAKRYCGAYFGPHGMIATGRSNEEELRTRLAGIMVQRPRSEILSYMPAKQRRVIYIDNDKPIRRKRSASAVGTVAKLIDAIAPKKHDTVIQHVLPELAEGMKVYVLTFRPKHAERLAKELGKAMNKRDWRRRMNAQKAEIFLGQTERGIDPRRRRELAKAFCEHDGAAVFIATIRSMPGAVSLKGVQTVHMVDFDTSPSSMEQAEDRGYEPGIPGYSITHYVMRNSIDDDLSTVVLPKFRTKDAIFNDENAQNVLAAFDDEEETMAEVMARHTAHLNDNDDDDDWM